MTDRRTRLGQGPEVTGMKVGGVSGLGMERWRIVGSISVLSGLCWRGGKVGVANKQGDTLCCRKEEGGVARTVSEIGLICFCICTCFYLTSGTIWNYEKTNTIVGWYSTVSE